MSDPAMEERYRSRYETLKNVYEQRLASMAQSIMGLSLRLSGDSLLSELSADPTSAPYAVAHADEIIVAEVHNEREQFIQKLAAALAEDADALRFHQDALAKKDTAVALLESQLHDAQGETAAVKRQLERETAAVKLQVERETAAVKRQLLQEQEARAGTESSLKKALADAERRAAEAENRHTDASSAKTTADNAAQAAEAAAARLRNEISGLEQANEALEESLAATRAELQATIASFEQSVSEEARESSKALAQIKGRMETWRAGANEKIHRYKVAARQAAAAAEDAQAKARSARRDLEEASTRNKGLAQAVKDMETRFVKRDEQIKAQQKAANDARDMIRTLQAQVQEKERAFAARELEWTLRLQDASKTSAAESQLTAQALLDRTREADANLYNKIQSHFEKERDHLYSERDHLYSRVSELESELAAIRSSPHHQALSSAGAVAIITKPEVELEVSRAVAAERERLARMHEVEVERARSELESKFQKEGFVRMQQEGQRIGEVREQLSAYIAKYTAAEDAIAKEKERAEQSEDKCAYMNKRVNMLNAHLEEANNNIARLSHLVQQGDGCREDLERLVEQEQRKKEELEALLREETAKKEATEAKLAEAQEEMRRSRDELALTVTQVGDMHKTLAALQERSAGLDADLARREEQVKQAEAQLAAKEGDLGAARQDAERQARQAREEHAQLVAVQAELGKAQSRTEDLVREVRQVEKELQGVSAELKDAEERRRGLERELERERHHHTGTRQAKQGVSRKVQQIRANLNGEISKLRVALEYQRKAVIDVVERAKEDAHRDIQLMHKEMHAYVNDHTEKTRRHHEKERIRLKREVEDAEERVRRTLKQEHHMTVTELNATVDEQKSDMRRELESTQHEAADLAKQLARLETKYEALEKTKNDLDERLQDALHGHDHLGGLSMNMSEDVSELRQLLASVSSALISVLRLDPADADRLCNIEEDLDGVDKDIASNYGGGRIGDMFGGGAMSESGGSPTAVRFGDPPQHRASSLSPGRAPSIGAIGRNASMFASRQSTFSFASSTFSHRRTRTQSVAQRSSLCISILTEALEKLRREAVTDATTPLEEKLREANAKAQQVAALEGRIETMLEKTNRYHEKLQRAENKIKEEKERRRTAEAELRERRTAEAELRERLSSTTAELEQTTIAELEQSRSDVNILLEMQRIEAENTIGSLRAQLAEKERYAAASIEEERKATELEYTPLLDQARQEVEHLRLKISKVNDVNEEAVRNEREAKREAVEQLERQIDDLQKSLRDLEVRYNDAQEELERLRRSHRLRTMARSMGPHRQDSINSSRAHHDKSSLSALGATSRVRSRRNSRDDSDTLGSRDGSLKRLAQSVNDSLLSHAL